MISFAFFPGTVPAARANTIAVNSMADPSDPGKCVLRDAIQAANTNTAVGSCPAGSPYPTMDTINVGFSRTFCLFSPCTIVLTSPLPAVSEDVTIHGLTNLTAISGQNAYRVFDLQGVVVNISNLRIVNGNATGLATAGYGGGINTSPNDTTLTVTGVIFSGNHASTRGGAIYQPGGTISVSDSTFSGNTSDSYGGAIDQLGGILIVSTSTLSGNSAADGGALEIQSASDIRLTNVTFSGNSARNSGGAISRIGSTYALSMNNVTISNNTADSDNNGSGNGGGLYRAGGTVVVGNSIIAGNFDTPNNAGPGTIHPDCSWPIADTLTSYGNNLVGRVDGCKGFTNGVNGDIVGTNASPINARLAVLGSYGGLTQTHALLGPSPARNAGNPATPGGGSFGACAATDQRGTGRPVGAYCDIGAYEWTDPPPFTNDPLTPGSTLVQAVHILELRARIDALRGKVGLGPGSYMDPALTQGTTIVRAQHVLDLRAALVEAYVAAGVNTPSFTDPGLSSGTAIKAVHITQLRDALRAIE